MAIIGRSFESNRTCDVITIFRDNGIKNKIPQQRGSAGLNGLPKARRSEVVQVADQSAAREPYPKVLHKSGLDLEEILILKILIFKNRSCHQCITLNRAESINTFDCYVASVRPESNNDAAPFVQPSSHFNHPECISNASHSIGMREIDKCTLDRDGIRNDRGFLRFTVASGDRREKPW